MIVCSKSHFHLLGPDGGLRHIESSTVALELEKQGFRKVLNPKREYYPEFDKTHPSYKEQETINLSDNDVLEVERI